MKNFPHPPTKTINIVICPILLAFDECVSKNFNDIETLCPFQLSFISLLTLFNVENGRLLKFLNIFMTFRSDFSIFFPSWTTAVVEIWIVKKKWNDSILFSCSVILFLCASNFQKLREMWERPFHLCCAVLCCFFSFFFSQNEQWWCH